MRASNYIVYVFVPNQDAYYLVHGYTGAVDRVMPCTVRFLFDHASPLPTFCTKDERIVRDSLRGRGFDEVRQSTLDMLVARGYLTERTVDEERLYVQRLAALLHEKAFRKLRPAFVIIPTYQCNLRCPYCYETSTRAGLNRRDLLSSVMSRQTADDAFKCVDRLLSLRLPEGQCLADAKKGIEVGLYGGEPLTALTKSIVEYVVQKGTEQGMTFWTSTNGVELDLFTTMLRPGKIQWLQVTLDGPKDIHDHSRIGPCHRETYERILNNVELALKCGVTVSVRVHANWKSVGRVHEVIQDLESRGLLCSRIVECMFRRRKVFTVVMLSLPTPIWRCTKHTKN